MPEDDGDRLKKIEEKLDAISSQLTELKMDVIKREDQLESRIQLLEDWKRRVEQEPKNTYYKWALIASWVSIFIAAVAVILK